MLDENNILKLSANILKRYEHNIENGVLFLYNVETEALWTGNSSSNDFIKFIDGKRNLKNIYLDVHSIFEEYEYEEIKNSLDSMINDLIKKDFLEVSK